MKLHSKVLHLYQLKFEKQVRAEEYRQLEQRFKGNTFYHTENLYSLFHAVLTPTNLTEYLEKCVSDFVNNCTTSMKMPRQVNFSTEGDMDQNGVVIPKHAWRTANLHTDFQSTIVHSTSKGASRSRSDSVSSILGVSKKTGLKAHAMMSMSPAQRLFEDNEQGKSSWLRLPSQTFSHDRAYVNWIHLLNRTYAYIHSKMSIFMTQSEEAVAEEAFFKKRMATECQRTFSSLHIMKGEMEIMPLQVQNLPVLKNAVFVRLSYGEKVTTHPLHSVSHSFSPWNLFPARNLKHLACHQRLSYRGTRRAWTIITHRT